MRYRAFGQTNMTVSEVGFGAWGIGGDFGKVEKRDAIEALSVAEEMGCNFVDTAAVYGNSEEILGEFLQARRDRWVVATKYSGQDGGLIALAERQLARMRIDHFDFYMIHWAPAENEKHLYEDLYRLKVSGKTRYIGVSLYTDRDIDYVANHANLDGIEIAFSLLDPQPFLSRRELIRRSGLGVIVRSCLKEGFLTGKFSPETVFSDPQDQRSAWSRDRIRETATAAERFRFLENEVDSMFVGAARYPLSFPETSTLILGTKSAAQAEMNFATVSGSVLDERIIERIERVQAMV